MQSCGLHSSSGLLPFRFHICSPNAGEKIQLRKRGLGRHTTLRTAGLFILLVCMCGVGMCMWEGVCTHMCIRLESQSQCWASSSSSPSYLLSQCLSLDLLRTCSLNSSGERLLSDPVPCGRTMDRTNHTQHFYMGAGDLSSGLLSCLPCTVLTEPSLNVLYLKTFQRLQWKLS